MGHGAGQPRRSDTTTPAQGAPSVETLTAYRVGVAELWSALVTAARGLPGVPADDVIELAGAVFAAEHLQRRRAAAYRDEARRPAHAGARAGGSGGGDPQRRRGEGHPAGGRQRPAAAARRAFLVIAAETEPGHDPIPRAEFGPRGEIDVRSVWRLDAEVSLGVLRCRRSRNGAVLTVLDKHATHRIGASPVFGELHQAGWALQLARLALGSNSGDTGVASSVTARSTSWSRPRHAASRRHARCSAACSSCPRRSSTCCSAPSRRGCGRAVRQRRRREPFCVPKPVATGCVASRPAPAGSSPTPGMWLSSSPPSAPGARHPAAFLVGDVHHKRGHGTGIMVCVHRSHLPLPRQVQAAIDEAYGKIPLGDERGEFQTYRRWPASLGNLFGIWRGWRQRQHRPGRGHLT